LSESTSQRSSVCLAIPAFIASLASVRDNLELQLGLGLC